MEKLLLFSFFPDHTFRGFRNHFFIIFFLTAGQGPFLFRFFFKKIEKNEKMEKHDEKTWKKTFFLFFNVYFVARFL